MSQKFQIPIKIALIGVIFADLVICIIFTSYWARIDFGDTHVLKTPIWWVQHNAPFYIQ